VVSKAPPHYKDIVMPKNTAMGIYISGFAFLMGFGFVWHIVWMILLGLVGAIACVIIRSFDEETEYIIPAAEVARIEAEKIPYYQ
jgi:cytochrome o ubiquinol oxidase subunit I